MESPSQLDLVIKALLLIRKGSSAVEAALAMPATDRVQLESQIEAVRDDLGQVLHQVGATVPGASALGRRPEVKMAAGIVEFLARQGATQLGVVAGVADTLRSGDSRSLAERIERQIAEAGVATRGELAEELGIREDSDELREGIERALGSGRAEWYGPGVYGLPRGQLEALGVEPDQAMAEIGVEVEGQLEPGAEPAGNGGADDDSEPSRQAGATPQLQSAVRALEGSLRSLGTALYSAGAERSEGERIRELRHLLDEGVISSEEYADKRSEILGRL